ncbi:hypothetical protein ABZS44_09615 [Micromonospora sediminicola]|uniref:hypothetical protein n=1 Tax=Micromonospora sediminicola TaxID=946078 RepID=UPI0033A54163
MDVVPDDLAELVHRAARAGAAHPADLAVVRRRAATRARRRRVTGVVGLVALVALTGGALPLLTDGGRPAPPVSAPSGSVSGDDPASSAPPGGTAQRLILAGEGGTVRPDRDGPEIGLLSGLADELTPDGEVVRHRVPAGWEQTTALPDGRLVGLQLTDRTPGTRRPDGPDVAGLSIRLVVLGPDDRVQVRREVRVKGQAIKLAGADARYAYLVRGGTGLVAHDLASGREKVLVRTGPDTGGELPFREADVRAGVVASVTGTPEVTGCRIEVRRLVGGARRAFPPLGGECAPSIRLSPDGSLVAVPYRRQTGARTAEYRVAVLDTTTGERRVDRLVGTAGSARGLPAGGTWGCAWDDGDTVRVVWAQLPDPAREVYSVADLARVVTVDVQ